MDCAVKRNVQTYDECSYVKVASGVCGGSNVDTGATEINATLSRHDRVVVVVVVGCRQRLDSARVTATSGAAARGTRARERRA